MATSDLGLILLVGSEVVLAAIVAARVAHGIGPPGLLVSLGLGLALGRPALASNSITSAGAGTGAQRAGPDLRQGGLMTSFTAGRGH